VYSYLSTTEELWRVPMEHPSVGGRTLHIPYIVLSAAHEKRPQARPLFMRLLSLPDHPPPVSQ
jgi:hypothetical protein